MRVYIGKISNLSKQELQSLVTSSNSLSEILRQLDLKTSSGNFRSLKRKLIKEQIDFSNIKTEKYKIHSFRKKIPLEEILVVNSNYSNPYKMKQRLIKEGLLLLECNICHIGPIWNNLPLNLQLDHINGIFNDNRLENLRMVCPNCHSQTETFAARNKKPKLAGAPGLEPR